MSFFAFSDGNRGTRRLYAAPRSFTEDQARDLVVQAPTTRDSHAPMVGLAMRKQPIEQLVCRHPETIDQPDQRREANLALSSLDTRYLHSCEAGLAGEVFLRPSPVEPCLTDVRAESL